MNVQELIDKLSALNPEAEVLMNTGDVNYTPAGDVIIYDSSNVVII